MTILIDAINANNFDLCLKIIQQHPHLINIPNPSGQSPLYIAAEKGFIAIVRLLCSKRARINQPANDDYNPLMIAIKNKKTDVIDFLIKNGGHLHIPNSPSHDFFIDCMQSLRPLQTKSTGRTHHQSSAKKAHISFPLQAGTELVHSNLETVRFMNAQLNRYPQSELYQRVGSEALIWACIAGDVNRVRHFIEVNGISANSVDIMGESALMKACEFNQFDVASYLINNGADINLADRQGWTPLMYAISAPSFEIANLLIEQGANLNLTNRTNKNALLLAHELGKKNIFNLIFKVQKNIYNILLAAMIGNHEHVIALSRVVPRFFELSSLSGSCLINATKLGYFIISDYLIENGVDINQNIQHECTLLDWALASNEPEIVSYLKRKGAATYANKVIRSNLLTAIKEKNIVEVTSLASDPLFIEDREGAYEAMNLVVTLDFIEAFRSLIEAQFPLRLETNCQKSIFLEAVKSQSLKCIEYLFSKRNLIVESEYNQAIQDSCSEKHMGIFSYLKDNKHLLSFKKTPGIFLDRSLMIETSIPMTAVDALISCDSAAVSSITMNSPADSIEFQPINSDSVLEKRPRFVFFAQRRANSELCRVNPSVACASGESLLSMTTTNKSTESTESIGSLKHSSLAAKRPRHLVIPDLVDTGTGPFPLRVTTPASCGSGSSFFSLTTNESLESLAAVSDSKKDQPIPCESLHTDDDEYFEQCLAWIRNNPF